MPAVVMPIPESIFRTPQQRRRYILKQDVARYGPTPECEACTTLAAGTPRVTEPHSRIAHAAALRQSPKRLDGCRSEWT